MSVQSTADGYRTDGAIENSKWDRGRDWTMPIRSDQVNDDDGAAGDSDRECQQSSGLRQVPAKS